MAVTSPTVVVQKSGERYFADHGWLKTYHSFSFDRYFDPANLNWGALRVFNDDRVAPAAGFRTHSHENMEILTYVLEGELEHKDSTGGEGVVRPGGVQFMSAGTGIRHSEFNHSAERPLHFIQMWVLPALRDVPPSYGQRDFDLGARRERWLTIASGQRNVDAPIRLTQAATLKVATLRRGEVRHTFEPGRLGFLFNARGDAAHVTAFDASGRASEYLLREADSLRIAGLGRIHVRGDTDVLLWDVPPAEDAPADA
jgi:redox-sensitive bicupin YhaK (pirin superfamily)